MRFYWLMVVGAALVCGLLIAAYMDAGRNGLLAAIYTLATIGTALWGLAYLADNKPED